jgi:hypothetical protein
MAALRQLPNGNWQAIVRRKGNRPQFHTFQSQKDARKWASAIESDIDRGMFIDRTEAERTSIGELIDRYLVEVTPGKKSARQDAQAARSLV